MNYRTTMFVLRLFQFDKNSGTVFRMKKYNRFVMSPDSRFFRQAANTFSFHLFHSVLNIVNFNADVVKTSGFVFVQKSLLQIMYVFKI